MPYTELASPLSHEVLKRRTRLGELSLPQADTGRQLAQRPVIRFWDAGEGQLSFDPGDGAQISDREPTPISISYRVRRK